MSTRSNIKADIVTKLEAIAKVREVSTKFKRWDEVTKNRMPYLQVIGSDETRERADSNKNVDCTWIIHVWGYLASETETEDWVENVRAALVADKTRGGNARDFMMTETLVDDQGIVNGGLFKITTETLYRIKDE